MTVRQKPCKRRNGTGCGQAVVYVQAASGGVIALEPYPLPPGHESATSLAVDVMSYGLVLVPPGAAWSAATKHYERHRCVTKRNAVPAPHKRPLLPQQTSLLDLMEG